MVFRNRRFRGRKRRYVRKTFTRRRGYGRYFKPTRRYGGKRYGRKKSMLRRHIPKTTVMGRSSKLVNMSYRYVYPKPTFGQGNGSFYPDPTLFRLNSIWDPCTHVFAKFNDSAAGYGYWSTFYRHSAVIGAAVTMVFRQTGTITYGTDDNVSNYTPVKIVTRIDDDVTWSVAESGSWTNYVPDPQATIHTWQMHLNAGDTKPLVIKKYFSTSKFFRNPVPWRSDTLSAAQGENPAEMAYLHWGWGFADKNTGVQLPSVELSVSINYRVMWTEPKDLSQMPASMALWQQPYPVSGWSADPEEADTATYPETEGTSVAKSLTYGQMK